MWHSCVQGDIDLLFARSETQVRETYDAFEALAREILPIRVVVQKKRICFQLQTRFSGGSVRKSHFLASFISFRENPSPRFSKIEHYAPIWIGHYAKLSRPEDVDDEVREWLLEAARYGRREHLDPDFKL